MIKAVVFDMGGVIHTTKIYPEKHLQFAYDTIKYLSQYGINIPDSPEVFAEKLNISDKNRRLHNEKTLRDTPPLEAWVDFYLKEYGVLSKKVFPIADELCVRWSRDRGQDFPREGLLECLSNLRNQGMRLGVISNTLSQTYVHTKLSEYGTSKYFEYILLSSVCGLRKPDTKIFDLCQETLALPKNELAYVGDTISRDVIGVRNAGWQMMIRIAHPEAKADTLEREQALEKNGYKPDYYIKNLSEIPEIIKTYNKNNP